MPPKLQKSIPQERRVQKTSVSIPRLKNIARVLAVTNNNFERITQQKDAQKLKNFIENKLGFQHEPIPNNNFKKLTETSQEFINRKRKEKKGPSMENQLMAMAENVVPTRPNGPMRPTKKRPRGGSAYVIPNAPKAPKAPDVLNINLRENNISENQAPGSLGGQNAMEHKKYENKIKELMQVSGKNRKALINNLINIGRLEMEVKAEEQKNSRNENKTKALENQIAQKLNIYPRNLYGETQKQVTLRKIIENLKNIQTHGLFNLKRLGGKRKRVNIPLKKYPYHAPAPAPMPIGNGSLPFLRKSREHWAKLRKNENFARNTSIINRLARAGVPLNKINNSIFKNQALERVKRIEAAYKRGNTSNLINYYFQRFPNRKNELESLRNQVVETTWAPVSQRVPRGSGVSGIPYRPVPVIPRPGVSVQKQVQMILKQMQKGRNTYKKNVITTSARNMQRAPNNNSNNDNNKQNKKNIQKLRNVRREQLQKLSNREQFEKNYKNAKWGNMNKLGFLKKGVLQIPSMNQRYQNNLLQEIINKNGTDVYALMNHMSNLENIISPNKLRPIQNLINQQIPALIQNVINGVGTIQNNGAKIKYLNGQIRKLKKHGVNTSELQRMYRNLKNKTSAGVIVNASYFQR